jgi:molybdenum cofactor cytidylyltransferase
MMPEIAAIVLAAGLSSRMGKFKLLLSWLDDKPIIAHILSNLIDLSLKHIVVVTGNRAEEVQTALSDFDATFAHNPDYAEGEILSSLKIGLQHMPEIIDAVLVVPSDLPRVSASVFQAVMNAYDSDSIIVPNYAGKNGHPVMFPRLFWKEILALAPDKAPRAVLKAHPDKVRKIAVDSDGILADIDTPDDYQRELKRAQSDSIV